MAGDDVADLCGALALALAALPARFRAWFVLARRAARSARREQEDPVIVAYLASLGTLLVLLARAVDGSPTVRVAWLLPRQRHRGSVVPG